jgi:hypothetical protein
VDPTARGVLNELSWFWLVLQATVPLPVALLAAYPFWRTGQAIFGNIVGIGVLFGVAFALIFREHAELDILLQRCLEAGTVCFPDPSAFTRFALYAFIALFEVFALFWLSLVVEERIRRRNYSPEWR